MQLNQLNPFTKQTSAAPLSPDKAERVAEGKRLFQGRTQTHLKRMLEELDALDGQLAQLDATINEAMEHEQDVTAALAERQRVSDRIHTLDELLTVAKRKNDEAVVARKDAELEAKRAKLREQLVVLGELGRIIDGDLATLSQHTERLLQAMEAAQASGCDEINFTLTKAALAFRTYLLGAVKAMPGCLTAFEVMYKPGTLWSTSLPDPDEVHRMKA
jgi:DNA repair exonuclease SbcCD ATPase subunit